MVWVTATRGWANYVPAPYSNHCTCGLQVMMQWEQPLMEIHADLVCQRGGDVLNVGFGLGLVDTVRQVSVPEKRQLPSERR